MAEPLISVRDLSFSIPVFYPDDRSLLSNPSRFLTDLYFGRRRRSTALILDGISFELAPGQRLGLIGANGAGKTSLLRVLAGIYAPSSGQLTVNGAAKGLFDLSLGMEPDATGLENIYLRGLQMGLSLSRVRALVEEVIDFSELLNDIEKPLHTYSAGMRTRLAVAVSTMIEPDILLFDEWIGTGDARFREKVEARMNALVQNSRGLIIATHNEALMKSLCTDGLVLAQGRMMFFGELQQALDRYAALEKEFVPPGDVARPELAS